MTISVSGSTQLARSLWVYLQESATTCEPNPSYEIGGTSLASGTPIGPGAFSGSYSYTPPDANASYEVCAYVDDQSYNPPDAATGWGFQAIVPPATVSVTVPSPTDLDVATTATVSGQTLVNESLVARACSQSGACTTITPVGGVVLKAGQYLQNVRFTPRKFGAFTITAEVIDLQGNQSGTGSASSTVPGASLDTPANHITGPQLNPRFTWQTRINQAYALVIANASSNGVVTPFVQIQQDGYIDLPSSSINHSTGLANSPTSLSGVATFTSGSGALQSAHLDQPLAPGRYAWKVISSGSPHHINSKTTTGYRYFYVLGPRLRHLRVRATATAGTSYQYPGYSTILIAATAYSKIKIRYTHRGHTATRTQYLGDATQGELRINWFCSSAGGQIDYRVTAYDDEGDSKTAAGHTTTVTPAHCHQLYAQLIAARRARNLAARRAAQRAQRRAAAQQRAAYERFVNNCEALGGTPVDLDVGGVVETFCRAPYGGYLYVPYLRAQHVVPRRR